MTEPRNTMPTELTKEKLGEIRERADRATPGPWKHHDMEMATIVADHLAIADFNSKSHSDEENEDNANFAAHARTDIPDLLDHIAVLTEERDRMREALTKLLRHDSGCVVSGEAGSGNPECCGYCFAKAALAPRTRRDTGG